MTDEELSLKAQQQNEEYVNILLKKYKSVVNKISRSYFLTGGDIEDIVQEGMIGLYKAIMNYSPDKNASFKTFASTCIKNQIQSAVKIASSKRNQVLSSALSFTHEENNDEQDEEFEILLPDDEPTIDEKLIQKERIKELKEKIKNSLSPLELKVLSLYLKGFSYNEIAEIAKLNKKSIDNALSRIKNKLSFLKNEKLYK